MRSIYHNLLSSPTPALEFSFKQNAASARAEFAVTAENLFLFSMHFASMTCLLADVAFELDDANSANSSILCPWEDIIEMQGALQVLSHDNAEDGNGSRKNQGEEEDEWLPGELEYYQQLCEEIYAPRVAIATVESEANEALWHEEDFWEDEAFWQDEALWRDAVFAQNAAALDQQEKGALDA